MNQEKYQEILEKNLIGWAESLYTDGFFYLFQDNAPAHTAGSVAKWMESHLPPILKVPVSIPLKLFGEL